MKTNKYGRRPVAGDQRWRLAPGTRSGRMPPVTCHGFTLIELLAVISIIAVLSGFTFYALGSVKKSTYIKHTQAELGQLQAAIDSYHNARGFYPPDNPSDSPWANQLYYELEGTTLNGGNYTTLDGANTIGASFVSMAFPGVGGFVNCNKPGAGEDSQKAKNFIHELNPSQLGVESNHGAGFTILIATVGGPDLGYQPLNVPELNPWRYRSSGTLTNNPGGYELWVQLQINGKKYLICNWSKTVQVNSPLP
jgi:prepilin-type N-terminal cleavage/methylation domain-containing protein